MTGAGHPYSISAAPGPEAELAHDLRSPLAAIRALAELVRDDAAMTGAVRADLMGRIVDEVQRLDRLVTRMLDGAPPATGGADAADVVRASAATMVGAFAARNLRLELELPGNLPCVAADADSLSRVTLNLLDNAARHAVAAVRVGLRQHGAQLTLSVADDGPGFEAAPPGDGRGLGLAICRRLVAGFAGTLHIHRTGPGARVAVDLPLCANGLPCATS